MKNTTNLILVLITLLSGSLCIAQDLTLQTQVETNKVILGFPINLKVTLQGKGKFTLPERFTAMCSTHTIFVIRDTTGNRSNFSFQGPCGVTSTSPFDSDGKTEYDGSVSAETQIFLTEGKYTIYSIYRSKGPYLDRYSDTDQRPVEGIWEGEISSNE